jgi:hypothetical protein
MQLEGALRAVPNGVAIRIKVTTSSRGLGVGKCNGRHAIRFKLTEPAQKGKANEQLVRYLAALFNKPVKDVHLVSGHTSNQKVALLYNTSVLEVKAVINRAIEDSAAQAKNS